MMNKKKRKTEIVEVTRFVACLQGYEDFNYKPKSFIHSIFGKKSSTDYKTEKEWKKKRLTTGLSL